MTREDAAHGGRIVVGVDGSDGAQAALRFALAEARLRGAELRAVSVWRYPGTLGAPVVFPEDYAPYDPEDVARRLVDEAIAALDLDDHGDVAVTPVARHGNPAQVLLESAEDADLLVVGSRGRGGFTGLLLGSVSQQCVQHAPCPVVVVPGTYR